jgi:glyoxylase-like metal-dependent hydrolase (beta-lactamase superfamily II)
VARTYREEQRMQSWDIGRVKITRVVESETATPYRAKAPFITEATPDALRAIDFLHPHFVTPEGHLLMAIQALLVEAPGLRLVVDTCIGNDKPRRMTAGIPLQTRFLHKLSEAGFSRESVDSVVCTHLHVDHVGWNTMREGERWVPTFPRARYLFAREEFEHWSRDTSADQLPVMSDSVQPIVDAGLAELVAMDHVLCPEVRLVPSPGHTPGHVSIAIASEGSEALITGDFIHHPCQLAHPEWCTAFDEDKAAALDMRRVMLEQLADRATLVIGTHFATPTAGHIKRAQIGYRFVV